MVDRCKIGGCSQKEIACSHEVLVKHFCYQWLLGAMVARGPPKSEVVGSSPIVVVFASPSTGGDFLITGWKLFNHSLLILAHITFPISRSNSAFKHVFADIKT
jgi:hypothetical protein